MSNGNLKSEISTQKEEFSALERLRSKGSVRKAMNTEED